MRKSGGYRSRLARGWYILRYHRPSQLVRRAVKIAGQRLGNRSSTARYADGPMVPPTVRADDGLARMARSRLSDRDPRLASLSGRALLDGEFCFLNERRHLPDPIDWRLESWPEAAHLWRFHLHYQEFLLDLVAEGLRTGEQVFWDRAWDIVGQWLASNRLTDKRLDSDAWHPYCISRRLPAWISAWMVAPPPRDALRAVVLGGIYQQSRYLSNHLERDLGGNHLLQNLRGLVIAGCFLECEETGRWLTRAARHLRRELTHQILPHGEHFERSPMYHAQMLAAILDIRDATSRVMPEISGLCQETAERMADFLDNILHPDGDIPLLGDSGLGEAPPMRTLLDRARGTAAAAAPPADASAACGNTGGCVVGDFWIFRSGKDYLVFDAGPVGPDHLPAHAHADLLNIEASLDGRRLIVDSGVFDYTDGPMRRYCRSSAAHNVLLVDGSDQCDMWSRFRMGYRGWPLSLSSGESCGFHWGRACHNAYRRRGVPVVGRWIACWPGGPWLCVDWAEGRGHHELTSRLHFHPSVRVEQIAGVGLRLVLPGGSYRLEFLAPGEVTVGQAWYCPCFGHRESCSVVQWRTTAELPRVCGWVLLPDDCTGTVSLEGNSVEDARVRWADGPHTVELCPTAEVPGAAGRIWATG